ncbi:hypothetical protein [Marimonas lutisalis]|uniref:hypothetical protein n=1 Tax=Marimonas lutisalis TaxID=2545756 RepID=UPI001F20083F|nr:hypothetical protein [Marimonas lutisalis]
MRHIVSLIIILALAGCGGGYHQAKRKVGRAPAPQTFSVPSGQAVIAPATRTPSGAPVPVAAAPVARPFATGPIQQACLASDRKARSRELCGCIQAVANGTLSASDQRLAVGFYGDPHRAQEIRQSDSSHHEAFWQHYKDYAERAESACR